MDVNKIIIKYDASTFQLCDLTSAIIGSVEGSIMAERKIYFNVLRTKVINGEPYLVLKLISYKDDPPLIRSVVHVINCTNLFDLRLNHVKQVPLYQVPLDAERVDLIVAKLFTNLEYIDMSFSNLIQLNMFTNSSHCLRCLDITRTEVTLLEPLRYCVALEELVMIGCAISSLEPLVNCVALGTIIANHSHIESLEPLHDCAALTKFECSDTKVHSLSGLNGTSLIHLNICNTLISDLFLVSTYGRLEMLYVSTHMLVDESVTAEIHRF
jgi:Leucine-rich repeat (LRR) protein